MKRTTLIAAVCAVLIAATGFAAAAPGNAPVSLDAGADDTETVGNDSAQSNGNGSAQADDAATDDRRDPGADADERNGQGPAVDLPDQVPDHVSAIHERISAFLGGTLEGSLGDAVSAVTPGDDEAADDADDAGEVTDDETAADDSDETDEAGEADETDEDLDDEEGEEADETDGDDDRQQRNATADESPAGDDENDSDE